MGKNEFKGTGGESLVQFFANKTDIIASPPQQDQFGWDLHLQFKSNTRTIFLDESESNYSVYVQVKEFDKEFSEYSGRSIKLSNIHHMVTSNAPCFVIYAQPANYEIYLVHVNFKIIEHGLKKIREAQARGMPLNKVNITINPHTYGIEKVDLSGNLKDTLIKIIGNSPRRYIEKKNNYIKTVGYTSGSVQLTGKVVNRDLLDVELGIKDSIEIELLEFNHFRFDIPLPYPEKPIKVELLSNEHAASIGLIENENPNNEELLLCINEESLPLSLSGKLRVSSQSSEYGIYAFDSLFFKLIIEEKNSFSVKVIFAWDRLLSSIMTIEELRHQLRVASIIFSKEENKFGFASLDGRQCNRTLEKSDGADISDILDFIGVLDNFEKLMKTLSISSLTPISPRFLFVNRDKYKTVLNVCFSNAFGTMKLSNLKGVNSGAPTLLFVPIQIRVLNKDYILTLRVQGNIEVSNNQGYLSQGLTKTLLPPIMADKKSVRNLFKRLCRLIEKDKENKHHIIVNTAMDKKLALTVNDLYQLEVGAGLPN